MVVKAELEKIGFRYTYVKIGEDDIIGNVETEQLKQLEPALKKSGLLLMDDKKSILVERIKSAIIELAHYTKEQINLLFPEGICYNREFDLVRPLRINTFFHQSLSCQEF